MEEFRKEMDKDGDGKLNREEIYHWLVPDDFDHIVDESNHLFSEADDDKVSFYAADIFPFRSFFFVFKIVECFKYILQLGLDSWNMQ